LAARGHSGSETADAEAKPIEPMTRERRRSVRIARVPETRKAHVLRWVALVALVALSLLLTASSTASAGTYVINNCPAAPGANGDPGPWIVFSAPQVYKGSCARGPGDFIGPLGSTMSSPSVDGVQVVAPAGSGITIREAKLWWIVPHQGAGADTFAILSANVGSIAEWLTPHVGNPDDYVFPASTTELTLADYCSADDAGAPCSWKGESANLELLGSELTLADSSLPSGAVTGGALISGGTLSGTESLSYDAGDSSSGVRLVQLRVDGNVVAQQDFLGSCPYTNFLACPPSVSNTLSWNTASVADGEHSLELVVQSAAQDSNVIYDGTIHIHNADASSLGALPGPGTATGPTSGTSTPNGAGASEAAQLRLGASGTIERSFAHRALRVAGRLLAAQGQPIGGATLDVVQQLSGASGPELVAHAHTGSDGTFVASLPLGRSRTIELAYRAFSNDADYAATAKLAEVVGAGVVLKISPRRTSTSGTIELSGLVHGPVPPRGVVVELLVHYRGSWEPFRTPRTDGHGRFHVAYTFEGGVGRFPFRAEVPEGQSGFPYAGGRSQAVDVATG
jgi:hypothetical protein